MSESLTLSAFLLESYQCFANMSAILGYNDTAELYNAKASVLELWVSCRNMDALNCRSRRLNYHIVDIQSY